MLISLQLLKFLAFVEPKVHYHVRNRLSSVLTQLQMNPMSSSHFISSDLLYWKRYYTILQKAKFQINTKSNKDIIFTVGRVNCHKKNVRSGFIFYILFSCFINSTYSACSFETETCSFKLHNKCILVLMDFTVIINGFMNTEGCPLLSRFQVRV